MEMNHENKTAEELYKKAMSIFSLLETNYEKHQKAIKMLEEAADMGYEPAIKELAELHRVEDESQV